MVIVRRKGLGKICHVNKGSVCVRMCACVCVCVYVCTRKKLRYSMSSSNEIAFSRPSQCLLEINHNGPLVIIK